MTQAYALGSRGPAYVKTGSSLDAIIGISDIIEKNIGLKVNRLQ